MSGMDDWQTKENERIRTVKLPSQRLSAEALDRASEILRGLHVPKGSADWAELWNDEKDLWRKQVRAVVDAIG